jgi:cystathionine beta-lyase/cystathionine gamma-synthase
VAEEKPSGSPVAPPIAQTSLFVFDTVEELWESQAATVGPPFAYSRISNPTLDIVEQKIALLEGTEACKCYTSGMAAISSAIMSSVQSGSHVVALDTCYGPTKQFLKDYLPKFGVESTFVDGLTTESFLQAIRPETTCLYLESPGSILFRILDIEAITSVCREKGITTILDNSYSSPIYQQPSKFGVDIVVHSATKYLGGHSDVVAGALCTSRDRIEKIIANETALFGGALPPFPAWLLLRGLRTLPMRMKQAQESGNDVFEFLRNHAQVEQVFHVGDPGHLHRNLIEKQMSGSSSLLSFIPKFQDMELVKKFIESLDIFQIGVSWGGFESLSVPLYYHPSDWPEPRWVIRLYLGFENPKDLVKDLERSFAAISDSSA